MSTRTPDSLNDVDGIELIQLSHTFWYIAGELENFGKYEEIEDDHSVKAVGRRAEELADDMHEAIALALKITTNDELKRDTLDTLHMCFEKFNSMVSCARVSFDGGDEDSVIPAIQTGYERAYESCHVPFEKLAARLSTEWDMVSSSHDPKPQQQSGVTAQAATLEYLRAEKWRDGLTAKYIGKITAGAIGRDKPFSRQAVSVTSAFKLYREMQLQGVDDREEFYRDRVERDEYVGGDE